MKLEIASPIASLQSVGRVQRKPRRPKHRFHLKTRPWHIQPMLLAPVLPGETLENLLLQSRVVTDPLSAKLVGWFKEYYFFYVKLRDLADRDSFVNMLVTGSAAPAATAASVPHYYRGDGYNFSSACLDRVVDEYFRDDQEAVAISLGGGDTLPIAAIDVRDYTQSLLADSATNSTDDELPGENPTYPANMSAFSDEFAHWEAMRDMGLVAVSFEDWLHSMGVNAPQQYQEDEHRPELIRYIRQWSYPSNTIDPSTGIATSAVAWSCAERGDKKRFFKEPGFIFGVTVTRPKVYRSKIEAAGGHYLDNHKMWLPGVLADAPYTSLKKFSDTAGPLAAVMTSLYWLDMRDLYLHGDQFVNHAFSDTDDNSVDLPTVGYENDYAAAADADALFANAAGGYKYIREDGVVDLRILSAHAAEDTTP